MKKSTAVKLLCVLAVLGSVVSFYATNLILSDIANMFYMTITRDCISSVPCFMVALDFVLASIYVMRFYPKRSYRRRQTIVYSYILMAFSAIGIITSLYSGFVIYGSMLAPYPFPYASVVFLVYHVLMLVHSFRNRKRGLAMTDGLETRHLRFGYIIYTIMLSGIVFFAYNRFGAFLVAPVYIQWRTFDITFPFYIALLLPMALLVHMIFYVFRLIDRHPDGGIIHIVIVFVMNIILGFVVMYRGYNNTQFIAAISPALGIERLLTMPVDTILHHALVAIFCVYEFIHAFIYRKNHKNMYENINEKIN